MASLSDSASASTLPVEIWTQIHCLACSDDGSSGRALSLVSKDWRTISRPFSLQSIALVGVRPILRFLALLEATPESLRVVHSLFIGCANSRPRPGVNTPLEQIDLAEEQTRGLLFTDQLFPELGIKYATTSTVGITVEAVEQAVRRILNRVAGTLQTLYTHVFYQRPALLYDVKLPSLRVLVLHGSFAVSGLSTSTADSMPNLRRLRIAGSPTPGQTIKPSVLFNTVAAAATMLTHFYVTQAALSASTIRRDLERALERSTLRGLERLVVEVGPSRSRTPPPSVNGQGQAADRERTELLRLAREDGRVRVVREPRWWIDVQAALIEWEEADELRWDERD